MLSQEEKQIMKNAFIKNPILAEKICKLPPEEVTETTNLLQEMEITNKQYTPGIRDIETSVENSIHLFIPGTYQDSYGREQKRRPQQ